MKSENNSRDFRITLQRIRRDCIPFYIVIVLHSDFNYSSTKQLEEVCVSITRSVELGGAYFAFCACALQVAFAVAKSAVHHHF